MTFGSGYYAGSKRRVNGQPGTSYIRRPVFDTYPISCYIILIERTKEYMRKEYTRGKK